MAHTDQTPHLPVLFEVVLLVGASLTAMFAAADLHQTICRSNSSLLLLENW